MALSEQEQRLLDEMERHLYQNEADVVSTTPNASSQVSTRSVVLAILAVVLGLGVVIGALAAQLPILGVVGFVVMLVGVLFAFRSSASRDGATTGDAATPSGPRLVGDGKAGASRSGAGNSSFMDRLEDRWDRRRRGE